MCGVRVKAGGERREGREGRGGEHTAQLSRQQRGRDFDQILTRTHALSYICCHRTLRQLQPQPPRATVNSRWAPLNTMARSHSHNANASDGRGRCATWPSAQREAILLGGGGVARLLRGRGGGGGVGGGGGRRIGVGHIPRGRAGGELDLVKEADVIVLGEALLRVTQRLRWRGWVRGCGGAALCVPCTLMVSTLSPGTLRLL